MNTAKKKVANRTRYIADPDKAKSYGEKWAAQNPEKFRLSIRKSKLMLAYGITIEQYDSMVLAQRGLCAICEKPETARHKKTGIINRLTVDHCHKTGKIRGLLCGACNKSLGLLKEDPEIIVKAASYVAMGGI